MPWTKDDASKHVKGLTEEQKKKWASIANSVYSECMDIRNDDAVCAPKAIRVANSSVAETKEIPEES